MDFYSFCCCLLYFFFNYVFNKSDATWKLQPRRPSVSENNRINCIWNYVACFHADLIVQVLYILGSVCQTWRGCYHLCSLCTWASPLWHQGRVDQLCCSILHWSSASTPCKYNDHYTILVSHNKDIEIFIRANWNSLWWMANARNINVLNLLWSVVFSSIKCEIAE